MIEKINALKKVIESLNEQLHILEDLYEKQQNAHKIVSAMMEEYDKDLINCNNIEKYLLGQLKKELSNRC